MGDVVLWILASIISFPVAYVMQFQKATLCMGRELVLGMKWTDLSPDFDLAVHRMGKNLSDTPMPRGLQDAVTPPYKTALDLIVYLCCAVIIGLIWWHFGWQSSIAGGVLILFFGRWIAVLFLPKPEGPHYRNLIIQSMCSRYANCIRDGDIVRAKALKGLLVKAGFKDVIDTLK